MAKNPAKKRMADPVPAQKAGRQVEAEVQKRSPFKLEIASMPWLTPYLPGILFFLITVIIGLLTYKGYGVSYDESAQRAIGSVEYDYMIRGVYDKNFINVDHGAGFELVLIFLEKLLGLTDTRDIYLSRHIATHLFFLVSVLAGYILIYRLYSNRFIASLGFIMLAFAPRIYAHSFFNTKDIPFMCMFTITLLCCQLAFDKNKPWLFLVVGICCGYATSIRVMGVMLASFIFLFMLVDVVNKLVRKQAAGKSWLSMLFFFIGFVIFLFLGWPYLLKDPVHNLLYSIGSFSHFEWNGTVLVAGKYYHATKLPWTYFPTWFLISNPEIWLLTGFSGIVWIVISFFRQPLLYINNTKERNFLLYLMCFFAPIVAVIFLHSVIYDDWRHLYFVYPSFVLIALYFINKMVATKYKLIVQGACALQVVLLGFFLINDHPFGHVYFNNLVSHGPEYLRDHYEMEYEGTGFYQGLDYLVKTSNARKIRVCDNMGGAIDHNLLLLPEEDRQRIQYTNDWVNADYLITNFRYHPYDYPSYKSEYSISVLNSTTLNVYKLEKDPAKMKQFIAEELAILKKALANYPAYEQDDVMELQLCRAYFRNGQYDSAEAHGQKAMQLNPASISIVDELTKVYVFEKKYADATAMCKKEMVLQPASVRPYTSIGLCFLYLKSFDSVIYYSRKGVNIDATCALLYENIARAYKQLNNADSTRKYETIAQKSDRAFKL